jgi:excisionase family DNA binding protein
MNLADAIRLASQNTGSTLTRDAGDAQIEVIDNPAPKAPKAAKKSDAESAPTANRVPLPPTLPVLNGSVVRMELFLSPEQLNGLFKAVVANQHSVMTLREAAQYLRSPSGQLEELAQAGGVPALSIDGKYRFSRTALDEWLNLQGRQREMEA